MVIDLKACRTNDAAPNIGNCDKFYITFEFEYQMWVKINQKFEEDWLPIHHLSN
jgi:hypothetical protein